MDEDRAKYYNNTSVFIFWSVKLVSHSKTF